MGSDERANSQNRSSNPSQTATYTRLGLSEGERDSSWAEVKRSSRSQLALITCVVLVLMAGAAKTVKDKVLPARVVTKDVGAPAVSGTPAVKGLNAPGPSGIEGVEKVGAGLMFVSEGQILLLKRNSLHNHDKWGLPGGNSEDSDADLFATARREAQEEIGPLPPFQLKGRLETRRGKDNQKHYTVFLASLDPDVKQKFSPLLNEEHSEWAWFPAEEAFKRDDLHPVVEKAFKKKHREVVQAAMQPDP